MRNLCSALALGFAVTLSISSTSAACVRRVPVRGGCVEAMHRVHVNIAEKISDAIKQQKLADDATARAKQAQDAADAAAAAAKRQQDLADDAIGRAQREEQMADAAMARAKQEEQNADQMKSGVAAEKKSADDLLEYLHAKIVEEKQAIDAAIRREQVADKKDKEATDKIAKAEAREKKANDEIAATQAERQRLDQRFDELLGMPPCGSAKKAACLPTS
jgi:colicin import membrane protein